jgi:hypothetical protein
VLPCVISGVPGCDAEAVVRDGANAAVGRERAAPSQRRGRLHPGHGRAPGHRQPEAGQRHVRLSVPLCDILQEIREVRRDLTPRSGAALLLSDRRQICTWCREEGAKIESSCSLAQLIIKQQSDRHLEWGRSCRERGCASPAPSLCSSLAFGLSKGAPVGFCW